MLAITCDGADVRTDIPRECTPRSAVIETTYEGNRLTIGFGKWEQLSVSPTSSSYIDWYGQLIPDPFHSLVRYCLAVTDGRPVHPQAPVRSAVIRDAALDRLHEFVWDAVFAYLSDPAQRATIRPSWVNAAYAYDMPRACRLFPFYVGSPCEARASVSTIEDLHWSSKYRLYDYTEPVTLVEGSSLKVWRDSATEPDEYDYGLTSLLPLLDRPVAVVRGDLHRLQSAVVWWRPGVALASPCTAHEFREAGEWGLGTVTQPPAEWHAVTCPVFAFDSGAEWDVEYVDFVIGGAAPSTFYGGLAWAGFTPDEDESYDAQYESYRASCDALIRQIIGDCVPAQFTLAQIQAWMRDGQAPIMNVTYCYRDGASTPWAIDVVNGTGESKRLSLYR
ncbi:MAG: hypothetical protein H0X24_01140 [Ktedonobacterales bacterium]|nr:hypothetical protein [Ktedonobacterales bacterium]